MNEKLDGFEPNYNLTYEDIFGKKEEVSNRRYTFLDDSGQIVDKDKATKAIIVEENELGEMIQEVFGKFEKPEDEKKTK